MSQVLRGPHSRCAVEVLRTNSEALLAMLDADCAVTLISHPLAWAEVGSQFRDGKHFFQFDEVWHPLMRLGAAGIEPYPLYEAVRKIIRGHFSAPAGFKGGSLDALMDVLPHGEVHLFTREQGFIGRFAAVEDAQMIGAALKAVKPIIFSTAQEFMQLGTVDQGVVLFELDPVREWPAKFNQKQATGVIEMAKAKTKTKAKKVEKAEAKQKRADGPVAKARGIFEKMKDKDSSEIIKACEEAGVNRGTATTQLGRWRKENGIVVKRGGARKKAKEAVGDQSAAATESPKPEDKKGKGKSKAKGKGIPPSSTKGEKRHNKKAAPSPSSTQSSSTGATQTAPSPEKKAASDPAAPATASSPSPSGTTASASPAASTPTGAPSSTPASAGSEAKK